MADNSTLIDSDDFALLRRSGRWYVEQRKLQNLYPQFMLMGSGGAVLSCAGDLRTNYGNVYSVKIVSLERYPYTIPSVIVDGVGGNPHYFGNGKICYMRSEVWQPDRTTLAFVIAKTAIYLNKYDFFLRHRRWPGADAHRL